MYGIWPARGRGELTLAGAILYACEGTKLRRDTRGKNTFYYAVEFTNANPILARIFMRFLREILEVDLRRIKGQIFFYPDHNEEKLRKFWSFETGIPTQQFQKSIPLEAKNPRYRPNPNGVLKIRTQDKETFLRLQCIIETVVR